MRSRLVRVHLEGDSPSLDGLLSRRRVSRGGHYILQVASVVEAPDRTLKLDGDRVLVPREKVLFIQELGR